MTAARSVPARAALVIAAAVASTGCFATRNDVRVLQADIAASRAASARADTVRMQQLDRVAAQLGAVADSLRSISARTGRFEGDAREGLRVIREDLIQVQELTGQSQRRVQELRAEMEQQREAQAASAAAGTPGGSPGDTAAAGSTPGPNQLYQIGTQQFGRGSYGTAREALGELLSRYPTADVAPDAQYFIAESYAAERNSAAADSAYAAVVTRYPSSPRAATALYKRARLKQTGGRATEARALFQEIVRRYPKSDEAELAREALRARGR